MFIQEAQFVEFHEILPKKFSFVKNGDSVIIWNRDKLGHPKMSMNNTYR